MIQDDSKKVTEIVKNCALIGIAVIFLLGSFMHSIYALSGEAFIVGLIAPVNESVWEHLKMAFFPTIFWWTLCYLRLKSNGIPLNQWFISAVISSIISPLFILSFYYSYTGAFGFHSLILDILSLFFGIVIAQLKALHVYQYAKLKPGHFYLALFIFIVSFMCFIIFTFCTPHLPLFQDPLTGSYGI